MQGFIYISADVERIYTCLDGGLNKLKDIELQNAFRKLSQIMREISVHMPSTQNANMRSVLCFSVKVTRPNEL